MLKILIPVIIILILCIIFIIYKNESMENQPTMLIMPEMDEKCVKLYGKSAFYDPNKGECYSCSGIPRNPSELVDSDRGCMGVVNQPALTEVVKTCRQEFGDNIAVDILNGNCYQCKDEYKDPSLVTKKCSKVIPTVYKKAYIGRSGVGPDGLNNCSSGYSSAGDKCWKCGTGYEPTADFLNSNKKCRSCRAALSRPVKTCDQEFVNRSAKDVHNRTVSCGASVGCDWDSQKNGTRRCFCCPRGYIRSWDPAWSGTACVEEGKLFPATKGVHWLRECAPGGWPTMKSGEVLAGGKYWSCPSGYNTELGIWEDPKKCCKYQGATIENRVTCKDSYGGKSINGIKYSNNYPLGVGWDPSGKCFACPDEYVRTSESVYNTNSCMKPGTVITSAIDFKRSGQGTEGWEKCPSGYVLDVVENKCWKCPAGLEAQILEKIDSKNKCIATKGPIRGVKLGKV